MLIKKGDVVEVISGDDRGKKGKVLRVSLKKNTIVVEGINYIHKHMKKSQKNPQGGRIDKEAPLNASKVMLFCGTCQKTTRCRFEFQVTQGKETTEKTQKEKFRCCSRCKGKI